MSFREIFTQLSLWIVNFYLKSYIISYYTVIRIRIRIQKAPE